MVHASYIVGDPKNEYCIASGGRCYKKAEVWASQLKKVKCPACDRQFDEHWAYEAHYDAVHLKED